MARFEKFWNVVCDYVGLLRIGFMFSLFLFVLSVIGLVLAPRGTNAFAISVVNFVLVAVVGGVVVWMNLVCRRWDRRYY